MKGIYCYIDLENNNEIVYVGKDSHIEEKRRHRQHLQRWFYHKQPFNTILQNNPDRYQYKEIVRAYHDIPNEELNEYEKFYIRIFEPKFNYTEGGDGLILVGEKNGMYGKHHSSEARKKMSQNHADIRGEKNPFYGRKHTEESRKLISKNHAKPFLGKNFSEEHKRKLSEALKGRTFSEETIQKMRDARRGKGRYSNLWNVEKTSFNRGDLLKGNTQDVKTIRRCFYVRYKHKPVRIGGFVDPLSPLLIYDFIEENDK